MTSPEALLFLRAVLDPERITMLDDDPDCEVVRDRRGDIAYVRFPDLDPRQAKDKIHDVVGKEAAVSYIVAPESLAPSPDIVYWHPEAPPAAVLFTPGSASSKDPQPNGSDGASAKEGKDAAKAAPPSGLPLKRSEVAELAHEGLAALEVPDKLLKDISSRDELGKKVAARLYDQRVAYARNVAWTFAPELSLLDRSPHPDQLARDMLRRREGLTDAQRDLDVQEVELKKTRVEQHRQANRILEELVEQVQKWTSIAKYGVAALGITLFFAMGMVIWLIKLVGDKDVSGWVLPAAIFALALFVVSPAVLLLRARPLHGIDEWMPGSKAAGRDDQAPGQDQAGQQTGGASGGSKTPSQQAAASSPKT